MNFITGFLAVEGDETKFPGGGLTYFALAGGLGVTWGWGLAKLGLKAFCWTWEGYVDLGIYFLTGVLMGIVEMLIFLLGSKGDTLEWIMLVYF